MSLSGFELKKCSHTLALLTLEDIVVISFTQPESLVVWETWLRSTCGSSKHISFEEPVKTCFVYFGAPKCVLHD